MSEGGWEWRGNNFNNFFSPIRGGQNCTPLITPHTYKHATGRVEETRNCASCTLSTTPSFTENAIVKRSVALTPCHQAQHNFSHWALRMSHTTTGHAKTWGSSSSPQYQEARAPGTFQRVDPISYSGCICANRYFREPVSTPQRLILPFRPAAVCGHGTGFDPALATLPKELAALKINAAAWESFIHRLQHEVQPRSIPGICTILSFIPHFWPESFVACCLNARYQRSLGNWLKELNSELLAPRGLYATFQTNGDRAHAMSLSATGCALETASWLAISLTSAETVILQHEPMLWTPAAVCFCATSDGSIVPHPCACCVQTGYCLQPCIV